jgi:hypothetical protein
MSGQLTSDGALATDCGDVAVDPEKKLDNFWLKLGEVDAGGATEGSEAAGDPPNPPPAEHPGASNASHSTAAIGIRSHQLI